MGTVLATVGIGLLALFISGLIFTLVVKLTESVGKYLSKKVKEWKRRIAASRLKELLDAMYRDNQNKKQTEDAQEMVRELGADALAYWAEDDNGNVLEETIGIIEEEQVDEKTKKIMDKYNGLVTIAPSAVC